MALTNNLKPVLDIPVWEWSRFAPTVTSAQSALTTSEDGDDRYMYYLVGSLFYRYDAITDSYLQLSSPITAPATALSLRYSKYSGNRARVLSQVNTSNLKIPYIGGGSLLVGKNLVIRYGSGLGQERTITAVDPEVVEDSGLCTSATALIITDTTKRWKPNQWVGFNCRITFSSGVQLQRTILYNTVDTLYFSDINYQPYESFDNTGFSTAPTIVAGSQSSFLITSQVITLNTPLTVSADTSSKIIIQTGTIWLVSSATSAPFFTWQMYDVANDIWITKTANNAIFPAAITTDFAIERTGAYDGEYLTGTTTSATTRTLTDNSKTMVIDEYVNYQIRIKSGTGIGQRLRIVANGSNYFEVAKKWDITPDNTSTYAVYSDTDSIFFAGNSNSSLLKYSVEADLWSQGNIYDYGVTSTITARRDKGLPFGITSGVRTTTGITSVVINNGGSGYRIGDVLTVSGGGGTNGKVYVETITSTGVITSVSLMRAGAGYSVTTGAATTGGGGTLATVNIVSVGGVCLITTTIPHQFKIGDSVIISGCTEAAYNTTSTIVGVDGVSATAPTTFDIVTTAVASMTASIAQSVTVIVDANANWDVNELVGKTIGVATVGLAGTYQFRRITSNTQTSITLGGTIGTAAVNGTSRYIITEAEALGRDLQYPIAQQSASGAVTSGTTSTIVDSSKIWIPGSWTNNRVRVVAGTGLGAEFVITANTETTLSFATQSFTPDTTTRYQIMAVFGIATGGSTSTLIDTTKNWKVNQWAGKRVRITGGTGQSNEILIVSNTTTTLTFAVQTFTPDTTTQYTILGIPPRGLATGLVFAYGHNNGRYIWSVRGSGASNIDRYDIVTDTWQYGNFIPPQFESFTTGSMYAYDGIDRIYINHNATNRIYYFDMTTREMVNSGTVPYGHGIAVIGNRMEIINGPDGLKFLYVMRHAGAEMWRCLLFW